MKFKIFLLTKVLVPKNQNEPMVTVIDLFSHVYEQLKVKVNNISTFCLQNDLCMKNRSLPFWRATDEP